MALFSREHLIHHLTFSLSRGMSDRENKVCGSAEIDDQSLSALDSDVDSAGPRLQPASFDFSCLFSFPHPGVDIYLSVGSSRRDVEPSASTIAPKRVSLLIAVLEGSRSTYIGPPSFGLVVYHIRVRRQRATTILDLKPLSCRGLALPATFTYAVGGLSIFVNVPARAHRFPSIIHVLSSMCTPQAALACVPFHCVASTFTLVLGPLISSVGCGV
ncbi:hypothetical protein B0H13DRAFT_2371982 [Mycena leptocephala]|nr:hypothetical protein B0H13DRAFT_2371982 [Mycena leptocephala]